MIHPHCTLPPYRAPFPLVERDQEPKPTPLEAEIPLDFTRRFY